jgi:peptidoglycan/LPS O-acetylase OafA/YrhL
MSGMDAAPGREHRSDVQALRALAVSAVLLFHLWPDLVPGGYAGVDVFFVISGFLITGLIARELEATGRIDLLGFFAGRIRRLLPAAFLVLGASLAVLVLFMPPVVWRANVEHIGAAAFYSLNWALGLQQVDYLAASQAPSLVQHYWSLSLEEQFYLTWPLLLLAAVWLGGLARRGSPRARMVVAVSVTGVLSLVLCLATTADAEVTFFSTRARAWEFALGGLVALLPALPVGPFLARLLTTAGLGAIVTSFLLLSTRTVFPGWATLIPTAGTALAIAAGQVSDSGGGVMSSRPVQWVGDHSYALYLWHWPPLVALPWIVHGELDDAARVGVLAGTVVLAWVTKALVEDPVRTGWRRRAMLWPSLGLAATGMSVLLLGTTAVNAAVADLEEQASAAVSSNVAQHKRCFGASALLDTSCHRPFSRPGGAKVAFASNDIEPMQNGCQLGLRETSEPLWCEWTAADDPTRTIAVVGNSFAIQLLPMLEQWVGRRPIRILLAARTGCLGLTTLPVVGQPAGDRCPVWSANVQSDLLAMDDLAAVVFADHEDAATFLTGQSGPGQDALAGARTGVIRSLRSFRRAGIPTAVVQRPPGHPSQRVPECIAMSTSDYDPCAVPRGSVTGKSMLARLAAARPRLTRLISLDPLLCDAAECHVTVGGVVAYKDDVHLTAAFSRTLARPLAPVLRRLVRR